MAIVLKLCRKDEALVKGPSILRMIKNGVFLGDFLPAGKLDEQI